MKTNQIEWFNFQKMITILIILYKIIIILIDQNLDLKKGLKHKKLMKDHFRLKVLHNI